MFSRMRIVRILVAAAILIIVSSAWADSAWAGQPLQFHITNITNRSFVVSWVSSVAEVSFVKWGRTATNVTTVAKDQRDTATSCRPPASTSACKKSTIHYVVVSDTKNLSKPTYFDVVSGTTVDNNATKHYQVRPPAPLLAPPAPAVAFGQVLKGGVPLAVDALVYYTVLDGNGKDSTGVSEERSVLALASEQGYWNVDLGSLRTSNLQSQFIYSAGDLLNIYAQTSSTQSAYLSVDASSANPKPSVNLADWTSTKKVAPNTGILFALGKWTKVLNQPFALDRDYWKGVKTSSGSARATFHCDNCSLIRWYTVKSTTTGNAQVSIDGTAYPCVNGILTTCDGYNWSKQWQYVWSFFLSPGPHDLTLTGPSVTTKYLLLDVFEVW